MYRELLFNSVAAQGNLERPTFAINPSVYVDRYKIISASVPLSMYVIGNHNNRLAYKKGDAILRVATIVPGNYTAATIAEAVTTALNSSGGSTFATTYDEKTRSLTITAAAAFQIVRGSFGTTSWRALGVPRDADTAMATEVVLPNSIDLSNATPLLLCSSALTSRYVTYVGSPQTNVLAMITPNNPNGSFAEFTGNGNWLQVSQQLQFIDFTFLSSDTLLPVDFQGVPFSCVIGVLDDSDDIGE